MDTSGTISTAAGHCDLNTENACAPGYSGDGGEATSAKLSEPFSIAVDGRGNLYIADYGISVIRKVNTDGIISTVAGHCNAAGAGGICISGSGFGGDGGEATKAELSGPIGVAVDGSGNIFIADSGNSVIRKVATSGIITTVAGHCVAISSAGNCTGSYYSGDGGPATSAELGGPQGVALDSSGNLFIADYGNSLIRVVNHSGIIQRFAGQCAFLGSWGGCDSIGYSGDGGSALLAELNAPTSVAPDNGGNLYIADFDNYVIRKVNSSDVISTIAGQCDINPQGYCEGLGYEGDGETATNAKLSYPSGVALDGNGNLYIADSGNSVIRKVTYSSQTVATPVFSVAGGTYASAQTVAIADATAGATIYYTTNGAAPTTSSTKYTSPITITSTETLKAIGVLTVDTDSAVATATYTIVPVAATPVFSPVGGTYTKAQTVTISDATGGATIYYTTNGTAPTSTSTKYTGAINVALTETLEAIAVATGDANSAVAKATYTITPPAATPAFSVAAGTYTSAQTVTVADATVGATVYYTTNGTTPTSASTKYTGPISVGTSETLEALAVAPGYSNSAVAKVSYTINLTAATPAFSVPAGTYESVQSVSISSATPGATIYYTTNGTAPTSASTKYTGPISVASSESLEAIAVETGYTNSAAATAAYTIVGSPTALASGATALTATSATLNGIVNTEGIVGSYQFDNGTSATALTSTTTSVTLPASSQNVAAATTLTGLTTNTTYYFKVVVTTAGGTASGTVLSFKTP